MSSPYSHRHRRESRRRYHKNRASVQSEKTPIAVLKDYIRREFAKAKRIYEEEIEEYGRKLEEDGEIPSEPKIPEVRFSLLDLMEFAPSQDISGARSLLKELVFEKRFTKRFKVTLDSSGSCIIREK